MEKNPRSLHANAGGASRPDSAHLEVLHAHDHRPAGGGGKIDKAEAAIEDTHRLVKRMGDDPEAADVLRQHETCLKGMEEKLAAEALSLKLLVDGQLSDQDEGKGARPIAPRGLGQMFTLGLPGH